MKHWRNYNYCFWFLAKYKILTFRILEKKTKKNSNTERITLQ